MNVKFSDPVAPAHREIWLQNLPLPLPTISKLVTKFRPNIEFQGTHLLQICNIGRGFVYINYRIGHRELCFTKAI